MNVTARILSLFLLAGTALGAEPAVTPSEAGNDLLSEALPILQAHYIDGQKLDVKPGDRLSDLAARSEGKITLVSTDPVEEKQPILTTTLPDHILYWRLASFTPEKSWIDLGTQLQQAESSAVGIILDLRSNVAPDDFAGAAQVMDFFAPADKTFQKYSARNPDGSVGGILIPDHPFHLPIVVLINNQTAGSAEALAACLRNDGALVMGRASAGKAAVFAEAKLSSGQVLRYLTENITLGDGQPMWQHPVTPDISLTVHDQMEKGALVLIGHHGIQDVIQEYPQRHRMSEAALVQGDDPEWDDYLASLKKKPFLLALPTIHDVVLISALDSLKAIRLSQQHETAPTTTSNQPAGAVPTSSMQ
ncbi:MAG: S41 family peptidase [Methylacidiphilales bacterium]|nr:S41 family peptidase [Candidatus Methylacidiphilales bacterium]